MCSEQKKKALDAIVRNVTRLDRLQKDILDITKIESNALTLNKERFSLTEKIREAIADTITNQIRKDASNNNKNIKIKFDSKLEGLIVITRAFSGASRERFASVL